MKDKAMKTRNYLLSATAILLAATAANAGGYIAPIVETEVVEVIPAEPNDWQGAYIGGTIGYAFGGDDKVGYSRDRKIFYNSDKLELSGVNGGVRLGYRWQIDGQSRDWVIGGELGYEGGNIDDSFTDGDFRAKDEINSVLAFRVKTGVLNEAQNTLIYGIVGIARVDYDYRFSGIDNGRGMPSAEGREFSWKDDGLNETGYIVGLGVERRLNDRISVTGEWEYANFGKEENDIDDSFPYSTQRTPDFHNIKIGLNYQF